MGIFDKFLRKSDPNQAPMQGTKKKVLVVEADENLRFNYVKTFQEADYEVSFAPDGASGLNALLTFEPHLIVIDLELPIMNGKTMLHSLRALPAYKNTPVIAIAEKTDQDTLTQVKNYDNASALLLKANTTPEQLVDLTRTLI